MRGEVIAGTISAANTFNPTLPGSEEKRKHLRKRGKERWEDERGKKERGETDDKHRIFRARKTTD